jgi:hypothetical protein
LHALCSGCPLSRRSCFTSVQVIGSRGANDSRNPSGALRGLVVRDCTFLRQPLPLLVSGRAIEHSVVTGNTWADGGQPGPALIRGAMAFDEYAE